jgi:hypothetical protein
MDKTKLFIEKNEKEYYLKKYKNYFNLSNPTNPNNEINIEDRNTIVRVDISLIHKLGVFANRDINKNEIITNYPAHYIGKSNGYSIYNINRELPNNFKDYMFDLDICNKIIIIGHPVIFGNMSWVGHKINDGYKHNSIIKNKKNIKKYNQNTKKYSNSGFATNMNNSIVSVIATKNIKKDEEILVSYGFNYWLEQNLNT